jgi:hypothetical protein
MTSHAAIIFCLCIAFLNGCLKRSNESEEIQSPHRNIESEILDEDLPRRNSENNPDPNKNRSFISTEMKYPFAETALAANSSSFRCHEGEGRLEICLVSRRSSERYGFARNGHFLNLGGIVERGSISTGIRELFDTGWSGWNEGFTMLPEGEKFFAYSLRKILVGNSAQPDQVEIRFIPEEHNLKNRFRVAIDEAGQETLVSPYPGHVMLLGCKPKDSENQLGICHVSIDDGKLYQFIAVDFSFFGTQNRIGFPQVVQANDAQRLAMWGDYRQMDRLIVTDVSSGLAVFTTELSGWIQGAKFSSNGYLTVKYDDNRVIIYDRDYSIVFDGSPHGSSEVGGVFALSNGKCFVATLPHGEGEPDDGSVRFFDLSTGAMYGQSAKSDSWADRCNQYVAAFVERAEYLVIASNSNCTGVPALLKKVSIPLQCRG